MQILKTLKSRKYGSVMYLKTVDELRTQRLLRVKNGPILRSQSVISRAKFADFRARGELFRAGNFTKVIWID